jgi:hypothetical protein
MPDAAGLIKQAMLLTGRAIAGNEQGGLTMQLL